MNRGILSVVTAAAALLLTGCAAAATTTDAAPPSTPSPTLCVDDPSLVAAVDTVWAAKSDPSSVAVHGEPGGRSSNLFELLNRDNLAAMNNPNGRGVVVSLTEAGEGSAFRETAHRVGWLVVDESLYPIDVGAAQAFGLLQDGFPPATRATAGLGSDYVTFESFGLSDFVAWNADEVHEAVAFLQEANALCEAVTGLGN